MERHRDPAWELVGYCLAPRKVAEMMVADETPPDVKQALYWATYVGERWQRKGEDAP